jgi:hypothetical protein
MIFEIGIIFTVLLAVFVLFYRQAIEQYNILQIEASQLSELPKLLSERTPLVLHDIGQPKLFTSEALKSNTRLQQFPISAKETLGAYLQNPSRPLALPHKASLLLAKESGLSVWIEHTWLPKFFSYPILQHIHSLTTEAHLGDQGLVKATAIHTVLYPTSGTYEVTLLTEQQEKCLPQSWRGRHPELFTLQDTPLVGEIKFITIKLRPGNMISIPSHWFYSVRSTDAKTPALWARFTIDNPISYVASSMETALHA